jgi:hypothetical protein
MTLKLNGSLKILSIQLLKIITLSGIGTSFLKKKLFWQEFKVFPLFWKVLTRMMKKVAAGLIFE